MFLLLIIRTTVCHDRRHNRVVQKASNKTLNGPKSLLFKLNYPVKKYGTNVFQIPFLLKWGASSRWSFRPNSAWGSRETTTTGNTRTTLF